MEKSSPHTITAAPGKPRSDAWTPSQHNSALWKVYPALTMRHQDDPDFQGMYDYLIKWHQVCDNIERMMRKQTESPLVQVLQRLVLKFVAEVRSVADCVGDADLSTPESRTDNYWRIVSLKPGILTTLDILAFCGSQEQNGHDGELNALFVRLNFEEATGPDAVGGSASWQYKARAARTGRVALDFRRLIDELDPSLACKSPWVGEWPPPLKIQSSW